MDYLKLFENIDYNNLITSYESYTKSKKKFRKILSEIQPLAIWIYKTIWEEYGSDFYDHDIDGNIEDLGNSWNDLFLEDVSVSEAGIIIYYEYEIDHKYGDSEKVNYYLEISREMFEHYQERFPIDEEVKKYNL